MKYQKSYNTRTLEANTQITVIQANVENDARLPSFCGDDAFVAVFATLVVSVATDVDIVYSNQSTQSTSRPMRVALLTVSLRKQKNGNNCDSTAFPNTV